MARLSARCSAGLVAAALLLAITPAFARGGGGRGGGGGHSSGGHSSGGFSSSHSSSYGSHSSSYGSHSSSYGSSGHSYSSPSYSHSSPSYGHSSSYGSSYGHSSVGGTHYTAPARGTVTHYGAVQGGNVTGRNYSPSVMGVRGSVRSPVIAGGGRGGYIGGGRGYYAPGRHVPVFVGGRGYYGRGVWWGPQYGWRVPVYWGGYYTPYPAYWGVGYWVTDWIMLDYLAMEEARMMAYEGSYAVAIPRESPPLPTDVREELRLQIEQYIAEPTPEVPASAAPGNTLVVNDPRVARALGAPHHVFVVSHPVSVTDRTNGGTCNITNADLLRTSSPVPSGQAWVDARVAASKTSSCPAGAIVAVPVAELVRFEQDLLERVGRGAAAAKAAGDDPAASAPPAATPPAGAPPPTAPNSFAPVPERTPEAIPQRLPTSEDLPEAPESTGEEQSL